MKKATSNKLLVLIIIVLLVLVIIYSGIGVMTIRICQFKTLLLIILNLVEKYWLQEKTLVVDRAGNMLPGLYTIMVLRW